MQNPVRFQDAAGNRAKKIRTRALLMDCAVAEFASKGIAPTSVDDIASKAEVSHGTFYYHFANKTEIVEAVGRTVAFGFVTIVDQRISNVSSGPERVALATQIFIEIASAIPNWGWLVVDALANMGSFRDHISRGIRKDVLIGIRSGDFVGEPNDLLFDSLLAVVGIAVRACLEHPNDNTIAPRAAEFVLQMLGISHAEARHLPLQVNKKYHSDEWNEPDAIQHQLVKIMPLLLEDILVAQHASS